MKKKSPADSEVIMNEIVMPNDTNPLGILRGGRLMDWMDLASAMCAQIHSEMVAVTASIDKVDFYHSVKSGDIVTIKARITRTFNSSMEICVEAWAKNIRKKTNLKTNMAIFTFVALDEDAKPSKVIEINPQTEEEQKLYEAALARRHSRIKAKPNA
jgi:acyl-CoA hydrolase